jgi:GT2 family glycosyltransferase
MKERPNVAAGLHILSPDHPNSRKRSEPLITHSFIGCGHMVRLSAVREINYYAPNPGSYGAEEKDLSIRLLNRGYEILYLPGVHVWHDKTMQARDLFTQHVSGVCNDLVFAYRRCPLPMALWLIPGKTLNHLRFSMARQPTAAMSQGLVMFARSVPRIAATRAPVSQPTFRKFIQLSRASL